MFLGPIDQFSFHGFIWFSNQQSLKQPRVFFTFLLTNSWSYPPFFLSFLPLVLLFCLYFISASIISTTFSVNCSSVSSRALSSFAFCCFCNIPLLDNFFSPEHLPCSFSSIVQNLAMQIESINRACNPHAKLSHLYGRIH